MKDIIITSQKLKGKKHLSDMLSSLFAINIIAILVYTRPWIEIFTQLGYVLVISFFIYFILWIPRILIIGLRHLLRKRSNSFTFFED